MPISLDTVDCYIHSEAPVDPVSLLPKRALGFDMNQQHYAWIPHIKTYENLDQFTLNTWIMPKSAPPATGNVPAFIHKDRSSDQSIGLFQHNLTANGVFHAGLNTGVWSAVNSTTVPVLNRWYMITLRYDGATFKLYVNGVEEASMAKTGVVAMTTDHWWIAHRPNTGQYLSMGIAELELWNYALTPAEITARYKPPNACSYKSAYVHIQDFTTEASNHQLHIVSDVAGSNPLSIRSSLGAMISVDGKLSSRDCFIAAGQDDSAEFDMITDVQNRSDITFDTIVFIRGGNTDFDSYKIGRVVYPLTRDAKIPLNVFTRDLPGLIHSYQDCYIMRHYVYEGDELSKPAYIVVGQSIDSAKSAFISGVYQLTEDFQSCFINGENRVVKEAYIEGSAIFATEVGQDAYINAEDLDNVFSSVAAYIVQSSSDGSILCHVVGEVIPDSQTASINLYIHTVEPEELMNYRYLFIYGAGVFRREIYAYIEGVFVEESYIDAYIVTNPVEISSLPSFINSSRAHIETLRLHLMANQPVSIAKEAYINSNLNVTEPRDCFIQGLTGREFTKRAFINSEGSVETQPIYIAGISTWTSSISSFIVNENIVASKVCHITGDSVQTTKPAFINSIYSVPAYIEGTREQSGIKRAYISSAGSRAGLRRAYIGGT